MIKAIKKVIKSLVKPFIKSKSQTKTDVSPQKTANYVGVPAPVVSPDDSWFGSAYKTEKAMEYVLKKNEELYRRLAEPKLKEPENIHQMMYERASKYWGTWKEELPGGSENFQENSNSWNSGTGLRQFK